MSSLTVSDAAYRAATEGCGVVDRSERGKLALSGSDVRSFLQGQVSNDVEALVPGRGCYAALLTPKGKMIADLRILDAGDELLLDTERVTLQELFNVLRRFSVGSDVTLHKRTLQRGLLSLIGPETAAALAAAAGDDAAAAGLEKLGPEEHDHAPCVLAGVAARAIRTDVGIDLLCDADDTATLAEALHRAGAVELSQATADTVRIEHGRPRYGVDLDDTVIPQEAGLNARAVSFTKGCYVGQETVARLHYRGKPNRQLRGLRLAGPAVSGAEITFEGRSVGRVGSVAESPARGPIALALVRREAPPGSPVRVGSGDGAEVEGVVVELPFTD